MVWNCSDEYIRGSIFRNNWYYFKISNDKFSYLQMIFNIFNVFRVFLDVGKVDDLIKDI